jgi:4-hydroxy-tetrahydrodipicolinate reductase
MGLRIAVIGAAGRLGSVLAAGVAAADDLELVAAVSSRHAGRPLGAVVPALAGGPAADVAVTADLADVIDAGAEVAIEVTGPGSVGPNLVRLLELGVHAVVGATGIDEADLATARDLAARGPARAVVAPNFSVGAVLLERLAAEAARHLPDVEIVELHHDRKVDAPSGTAIATAAAVAAARRGVPAATGEGPARGERHHGVPVHAVRLPGLVAHEEVLFGAPGQVLSLRHDVMDRSAFVPGALLACRRVGGLDGLVVGLGALLD